MKGLSIMDIDTLFAGLESPGQMDMKLNFKKFFLDSKLSPKEAGLTALACAQSLGVKKLISFAEAQLQTAGASAEEISEAKEAASIMGVMNMFYRFRHFVGKDAYQKPAGLRMNVMARPVTGKATFEMMAFAVSILNGCESCVKSHEASLLQHGATEDQIYDLARLSSVIKGLQPLLRD
jgi:alkyl hydroperoxide reductase subunit D